MTNAFSVKDWGWRSASSAVIGDYTSSGLQPLGYVLELVEMCRARVPTRELIYPAAQAPAS
jgi:hypothetical protein